jgi:hypothetical protein
VAALTQSILGLIFSIAYWPPQTAELPGLADLIIEFATKGLSAGAGRRGPGPRPGLNHR